MEVSSKCEHSINKGLEESEVCWKCGGSSGTSISINDGLDEGDEEPRPARQQHRLPALHHDLHLHVGACRKVALLVDHLQKVREGVRRRETSVPASIALLAGHMGDVRSREKS